MRTERNIANILIVKDVATTVTAGNNIEDELSGLSTGEAVVLSPAGVILDSAVAVTANTEFKIATKLASGALNYSDIIKVGNIKSMQTNRYAAAANQIDYVGYNGTDQSIEDIKSNIYTVRMYLQPTDVAGQMQQKIKRGVYKSDSSATQGEIAAGLTQSLIYNFSREPEKLKYGYNRILFERVNSGLGVATSAGAITFTKGSKYVSWPEDGNNNDAGKYNADGASVAVGDYIRVGHATTTTYPVYKVASITGAATTTIVLELDIPYQGETETVAAASCGIITAALAAAGSFGIKISGSAYAFDPPKFNYLLPRWKTTLQDCGTTVVTESTKPSEGQGNYKSISMMEQQFQGNEGNFYRAQVPSPTFRTETDSTKTYALVILEFLDRMESSIGGYELSKKQLYIACEKAATAGTFTNANTGLAVFLTQLYTYGVPSNVTNVATEIAA